MNHISRRDLIQTVAALLGGAALAGGDSLLALACDEDARAQVTAKGIGEFSSADVALLDEIADTILPETSTPGAKAAKTGAFMALSATDVYTLENQAIFRDGLRKVDEAARSAHGVGFVDATPAQRLAVLQVLDREQKAAMDARPNNDEPRHYFRLMKELALLGYFTSEIGCTKALQYVESPGRYDPCAPFTPGDRAWAGHA
jgi:hypothetical protein